MKDKEETQPESKKSELLDTAKEAAVSAVVTVVVTAVATAAVGAVYTLIQNRTKKNDKEDEAK